jgi:hypothetical protein
MTGPLLPDGGDAGYWAKTGARREQEGDIAGAMEALDRTIAIQPQNLNYWKGKEKLCLKAEKKREAVFYHIILDAMIPAELKYLASESIPELFGRGLMAYGRHYAELYNTYFRHQSLEGITARHAQVTP